MPPIGLGSGLGFRADPELQERIEELAEKSTEGQRTEAERAEYSGYVRATKFVAILPQHARRLIDHRFSFFGQHNLHQRTYSAIKSRHFG